MAKISNCCSEGVYLDAAYNFICFGCFDICNVIDTEKEQVDPNQTELDFDAED